MGKEKPLPGLLCQIFVCVRVCMCVFVFSHAIVTAASPETTERSSDCSNSRSRFSSRQA
jgi:hypothetical protein